MTRAERAAIDNATIKEAKRRIEQLAAMRGAILDLPKEQRDQERLRQINQALWALYAPFGWKTKSLAKSLGLALSKLDAANAAYAS